MFFDFPLEINRCAVSLIRQVNEFFCYLLFEVEPGINFLQRRHRPVETLYLLRFLF